MPPTVSGGCASHEQVYLHTGQQTQQTEKHDAETSSRFIGSGP